MTTRSKLLVVAAAVAVLLVVGLIFSILRRGDRVPEAEIAVTEVQEPSGPLRLEMSSIDGQPLAAGTPIFLDVSLTALAAEDEASGEPARVGDSSRPWWASLRLVERADGADKLPTIILPLSPEPTLRSGPDETGYAEVAITPDSGLAPGTHHIQAVWTEGALEARSNVVVLEIAKRTSPASAAIARSRYELWRGEPAAALTAADEGLAASDTESELHSLRGQSLEALGRLKEAREAASRALQLVLERERPKTPLSEPPTLYIVNLRRIEEKLARQARGEEP